MCSKILALQFCDELFSFNKSYDWRLKKKKGTGFREMDMPRCYQVFQGNNRGKYLNPGLSSSSIGLPVSNFS